MDLELKGKRAFVTGASRGIGKAVAWSLASEGCDIEIAARTHDDLIVLARQITDTHGVKVGVHRVDVARADDREELAAIPASVDILVNCAGAIAPGTVEQVSSSQWRADWDLKVFGYFELTKAFYRAMKQRQSGVIINVIGDAGEKPSADYIAGSTGNAALMAFTQALGAEAPDHGIRVLGVNPGLTASDRSISHLMRASQRRFGTPDRWQQLVSELNLPFARMAHVEEVADVVAFLASRRASYVSGTIVTIDGGRRFRSASQNRPGDAQ